MITVSGGGGEVSGWIDFDQSGTFDAAEQIVGGYAPDGMHPRDVAEAASIPRYR